MVSGKWHVERGRYKIFLSWSLNVDFFPGFFKFVSTFFFLLIFLPLFGFAFYLSFFFRLFLAFPLFLVYVNQMLKWLSRHAGQVLQVLQRALVFKIGQKVPVIKYIWIYGTVFTFSSNSGKMKYINYCEMWNDTIKVNKGLKTKSIIYKQQQTGDFGEKNK